MTVAQSEKPAFHIGLAMAGAVSGGAYSAGVFDFLVEALNEWQKAKDRGAAVPQHDVIISTVAGTSAGGITAALGLMSLAGGIRSVEEPAVNPEAPPIRRVLPELYDLWVRKLRLFGAPDPAKGRVLTGNQVLLDTGDIDPKKMPKSALNSEALTRIAREALSTISPNPARQPLAFFTKPTHLFLTRANLDGIPRPVSFGKDGYIITQYEGRAHYAVTDLGARAFPNDKCQWLKLCADTGDRIKLSDLGTLAGKPTDQPFEPTFEALTQATLATSAVPVVFAARQILAPMDLEAGFAAFANMFKDVEAFQHHLEGAPKSQGPDGPRAPMEWKDSICVDGGTMNNEPFELVRWAIRDLEETGNAREPEKADRAVILIAPFPPKLKMDDGFQLEGNAGLAAKGKDGLPLKVERDMSIKTIAKMAASAYFKQARYKATDLVAASDPGVYSRYLISPKRDGDQTKPAMATGVLKAAGGFLDEQFREHDFQLGRRNCQWFLLNHFVLHPSNPVFGPEAKDAAKDERRPIVPLFGTADVIIGLPPWPKMPRSNLDELRAALLNRFDAFVAATLAELLKSNMIVRAVARIWWWWRRQVIVGKAMAFIEGDLMKNDQLGDLPPVPPFWKRQSWVLWLLILLAAAVGCFLAYERWLETI